MEYHFASEPGEQRDMRIVHPLWDGELTLGPDSRMSFVEGLSAPINIVKATCIGSGGYRRSARAVRRHERPYHVLTFIDCGRISYSPSHETFVLDPDFFTVTKNPTGYVAKFLPDDANRVETYTLRVPDHLILPYLKRGVVYGRPLPVTEGAGPAAKALAKLMFEHGHILPQAALDKAIGAFLELVAHMVQEAAAFPEPPQPAQARHFSAIEHYVDQNIANPELSLARVAAELHLSTRYVSSIFRARNIRFRDYIKQNRITLARRLLATLDPGAYSIGEIAALTGFSTASQFATAFKALTGATPGAYRRDMSSRA